ncbi:uncharacterized protein SAPINGB_P000904 [Magnusiomyces paraingens]|uniref:Uncharacterized protein n=1 Tax=Magnusiomyces paraingens TaxID=2606893 RepID=A0A5E8B300_9ASCO|nr:uncharacterized protein SAPINGB_P000904 [Saprochaete ingens]VVT45814.1 unnamed protein product [Saprochaete ingens]
MTALYKHQALLKVLGRASGGLYSCVRNSSNISVATRSRRSNPTLRDLNAVGHRLNAVNRLPPSTVRNALRRKVQREKEQRSKLAALLDLPQQPEFTEIKTVEDLKRVVPFMPPEQQERVQTLIAEYGDGLNEYLEQAANMAEQGTLEEELEGVAPRGGNDKIKGGEYGAAIELLQQMVEEVIEEEETPPSHDSLWRNVNIFKKMRVDPSVPPPLELLVILFQIAKNETDETVRNKALMLVGNILYGYQLVRLDPYNEVDYLNALVKGRKVKRAIDIWKSRRAKQDVENSIYWVEVGSCLYQEVYDMKNAEKLAAELIEKFDYVPPKVTLRFIKCYVKMHKADDVWRWTEYMIDQVKANGAFGEPVTISGNFDPEEADAVFNAKHIPTARDILTTFDQIMVTGNTVYGLLWFDRVTDLGLSVNVKSLLSIFNSAAKNITKINQPNTLKLLTALKRTKKNSSNTTATSLSSNFHIGNNLIDQLAFRLLNESPELAKNSQFYQIWIYGLMQLNDMERVSEVLQMEINQNLLVTSFAFHSTLKTLLNKKKLNLALELLDCAENPGKFKLNKPQAKHYALFIQYGARRHDEEFVKKILNRMTEHGVGYDESVNLALFHFYYRMRQFTKFFNHLEAAINLNGHQFSTEGYTVIWTIIRDYLRSNPSKVSRYLVTGSISEPDLHFDLNTNFFNMLLLRMMQSKDFVPSTTVYERAIQTFLIVHDYTKVFALVKFMGENNQLALDPAFCFNLTNLAKKMGKIAQTNRILKNLNHQQRPPTLPSSLFSNSQNTAINSIAVANSIAQNRSTNVSIPLETFTESLCLALNCKYSDYEDSVAELVSQFA